QVDPEVVLGLQHTRDTGQRRLVDELDGRVPPKVVDGVGGVAVAGVRRAGLRRAAQSGRVREVLPAGDAVVAAVQSEQGFGDLGDVVDEGQCLCFGEPAVAGPGGEVVLTESAGAGGVPPELDQ